MITETESNPRVGSKTHISQGFTSIFRGRCSGESNRCRIVSFASFHITNHSLRCFSAEVTETRLFRPSAVVFESQNDRIHGFNKNVRKCSVFVQVWTYTFIKVLYLWSDRFVFLCGLEHAHRSP